MEATIILVHGRGFQLMFNNWYCANNFQPANLEHSAWIINVRNQTVLEIGAYCCCGGVNDGRDGMI